MEASNIRITESLHTCAQWSLFKDTLVFNYFKIKIKLAVLVYPKYIQQQVTLLQLRMLERLMVGV